MGRGGMGHSSSGGSRSSGGGGSRSFSSSSSRSSSGGGGSSRTHYSSSSSGRGGRGSSSSFNTGGGSSYNRHYSSPPPHSHYHHHHHHTSYGYGYGYGSGYRRRTSPSSFVAAIIVVFAVIFIIATMSSCESQYEESKITQSTMPRSALANKDCQQINSWYEDNMPDRWIYNEAALLKGMKIFYTKTGVQPYLVLVPSVNGDKYPTDTQFTNYLAEVYDDMMPDGGHLVVGFLEGNSGDYTIGCYAGMAAETVMDSEAQDILLDYLEYYYTSNMDDEVYFSTVFEKTADKIMHVDEITEASKNNAIFGVAVVTGILAIVIVVSITIVKRRRAKAAEAAAAAQILNSNLSGTIPQAPDAEDLRDKYNV